jgi:hypothetical protein
LLVCSRIIDLASSSGLMLSGSSSGRGSSSPAESGVVKFVGRPKGVIAVAKPKAP